jgi:hypothetical protein
MRCGKCGREMLRFEEYQRDAYQCPGCGDTTEVDRVRTLLEFQASVRADVIAEIAPSLYGFRVGPRGLDLTRSRVTIIETAFAFFAGLLIGILIIGSIETRGPWLVVPYLLGAIALWMYLPGTFRFLLSRRNARRLMHGTVTRGEVADIRTLALMCLDRQLSPVATDQIARIGASLSDGDASNLGVQDLRNILWLLTPAGWAFGAPNWQAVTGACRVLSHTRYGRSLWVLGRLATGQFEGCHPPDYVRVEASIAAKRIRERLIAASNEPALLRAASPLGDATSLLRAGDVGHTERDELLREVDPDE